MEKSQLILWLCILGVALFCVFVSTYLSLYLIYKHLRNYTKPALQKPIVRILGMVPVYAVLSFFSLLAVHYSLVFDLIRNCYEAYLLYQFFILLVQFINTYEIEVQEATHLKRVPRPPPAAAAAAPPPPAASPAP